MRILNPIYDTVFKYLMEDIEIAKGFISAIIEQEVIELIPAPQETTSTKIKIQYASLEIQHLDYVAHIKTINADGNEEYERVMIEVQKSPFAPAIGRFRKYLAEKYKNISVIKTKAGEEKIYLPLKTIYIIDKTFNENLPCILKRNSQYIDVLNKTEYAGKKDKFVELLTHEAWFIQLQKLPHDLKTTITRLLSVFTPWYRVKGDERYLNFPVEDDDLKKIKNQVLRRVLRRLFAAVKNDKLKLAMEIEIEYEDFFEQQIEIAKKYKKEKEEKEKQLKQEIEAKNAEHQKVLNSAKEMKKFGMTMEIIIKTTGLSKEEIGKL